LNIIRNFISRAYAALPILTISKLDDDKVFCLT